MAGVQKNIFIIPVFLTRLGGPWYTIRIFIDFERIENGTLSHPARTRRADCQNNGP
jgi:hypothetical protein